MQVQRIIDKGFEFGEGLGPEVIQLHCFYFGVGCVAIHATLLTVSRNVETVVCIAVVAAILSLG